MKPVKITEISSLRNAISTAARSARRKAFRKGLPVAVSKNGKVVLIYKDKTEVNAHSSSPIKIK